MPVLDQGKDPSADIPAAAEAARGRCPSGLFGGLSGKLLWLTVVFIMLAEILIFFPSVASMRMRWLQDRLNTAAAAAIVIDGLQPIDRPRALQKETLEATGTKAIVLRKEGTSRLLATTSMPASVDESYDLTDVPPLTAIRDALDTLIFGGSRIIRVYGPVGENNVGVEVVMKDRPHSHRPDSPADRQHAAILLRSRESGPYLHR